MMIVVMSSRGVRGRFHLAVAAAALVILGSIARLFAAGGNAGMELAASSRSLEGPVGSDDPATLASTTATFEPTTVAEIIVPDSDTEAARAARFRPESDLKPAPPDDPTRMATLASTPRASTNPPLHPQACGTSAHFVWAFPMPLGRREAAAIRSLLNVTATPSAPVSWTHMNLHVADRTLAEVDKTWENLLDPVTAHAEGRILISIVPLRLRPLFRDSPLEAWIRQLTRWKVVSGPDFPYQLDSVVRLAVAWKYGGHVFPADFVRHPQWTPPATRYVVRGPTAPGAWPLELGPICTSPGDPRLYEAMHQVALALDACVAAGHMSASGPVTKLPGPCVLPILHEWTMDAPGNDPSCTRRSFVSGPIAPEMCPSGQTFEASTVWRPMDMSEGTDRALASVQQRDDKSVAWFLTGGARDGGDSQMMYVGMYLAHRLLGQRALPPSASIVTALMALGLGDCMQPGYPWHQGCHTVTATSDSDWKSLFSVTESLRQSSTRGTANASPHLTSFGVLSASASANLGDDIQTLAAAEYLPFLGYYVDRDRWNSIRPFPSVVPEPKRSLSSLREQRLILTITNGWWDFMTYEATERNSTALAQLVVSMHLTNHLKEELRVPVVKGILKLREPIGARDMQTFEYFQMHDIASFFTGCLTTTLTNVWKDEPRKNVLVVPKYSSDLETIRALLPTRVAQATVPISIHMSTNETSYPVHRLLRAWDLMRQYATARMVVTSALHSALPSLAFDTPMVFVHDELKFRHDERFPGLVDLFPRIVLTNSATTVPQSNPFLLNYDYAHPDPPSVYSATAIKLVSMRQRLRSTLRASCAAIDVMLAMTDDDA